MIRNIIGTALLVVSLLANAANFSACPQFFVDGIPPTIQNEAILKPRALCFSEFAIVHARILR